MSKELIERLRDTNKHTFALWFDAADAIESLLAENERLNAECYEWEANSKQWEQEYYKKDTELAKYRDAPVVAWVEVVDSYEGPYHFHGQKLLNVGKHKLIVKPGEEK